MKRTVKVLTKEEINKRYPKENDTRMAKLTREAIELGCSIAFIEQKGLAKSPLREREIEWAIYSLYPRASYPYIRIVAYTDVSELSKDRIYCAFKVDESDTRGYIDNTFHNS